MQQENTTAYDAIIVGSGPGGATTAKELSKKGKKVLLLEWGANPVLNGSFWKYIRYQLIPFKSLLITNKFLGMVRGIITGGSSLFYYATCFKVPIDMLKSYGIDLTKEVKEAREELPIAPLKDELMTPMANRIKKSAQDLGYNWQKLEKFIYQDKWQSNSRFPYYGDPHNLKWSAKDSAEEAVQNGAVLLNKAKVKKVIIENEKAVGVEFKMNGKQHKAFAPDIVISAGGIGSPVILRNSGIEEAGYNFFFDPLISVCGTVKDIKAEAEIPMSAGIHMEEEGYMMTDMSLPSEISFLFALEVFRFHRIFSQKKTLRIMIKAKDDLGGKITPGGQVRKKLSKDDKAKLMDGYKRAKEILKNAGAKGIYKTWYLAAHPGGTVKVGELLDSNLKTKKYDNLYVCDCSVIPEAWGLPPTLTIVALGKRLAAHLTSGTTSNKKKARAVSGSSAPLRHRMAGEK
ncbi:MAG: GMC family oxidoreductase [bacterium]|nr:GMC family oxidoreductase [bacterium]